MPQPVRILLLDDGELSNVARILEALGLEHTRLRGQQVVGKLPPPSELLITTSRCAKLVRRGSPKEAAAGRPIRIIGVQDNSTSMRRMLRRIGYHLLVGLPGSDEIWRPLIGRATYRGSERRDGARVLVGSSVTLTSADTALPATLMDLSSRSCRLLVPQKLAVGTGLALALPEATTGSRTLTLDGRVTRISEDLGEKVHAVTLAFDTRMSPDERAELSGVVNLWSVGPPSPSADQARVLPLDEEIRTPGEPRRIQVSEEAGPALQVPVTVEESPRTK